MKFAKLIKQNRMATEWGPVFHEPAVLPYPVRVKRGVLDQLLPGLRLSAGNPRLGEADANRVVVGLVEQNRARLEALLGGGNEIAQFPMTMQVPLPLVLHLVYAEKAVWVTDQPFLPYPAPKEED